MVLTEQLIPVGSNKYVSPDPVSKTTRPPSIRRNFAPEFFFTTSADFAGTKTSAVVFAGMIVETARQPVASIFNVFNGENSGIVWRA